MSDTRSGADGSDKSWIEKIALAFSAEPKTRQDLSEILEIARDNDVIDADVHGIMEGAMEAKVLRYCVYSRSKGAVFTCILRRVSVHSVAL